MSASAGMVIGCPKSDMRPRKISFITHTRKMHQETATSTSAEKREVAPNASGAINSTAHTLPAAMRPASVASADFSRTDQASAWLMSPLIAPCPS
jgi:hypothetical protein